MEIYHGMYVCKHVYGIYIYICKWDHTYIRIYIYTYIYIRTYIYIYIYHLVFGYV